MSDFPKDHQQISSNIECRLQGSKRCVLSSSGINLNFSLKNYPPYFLTPCKSLLYSTETSLPLLRSDLLLYSLFWPGLSCLLFPVAMARSVSGPSWGPVRHPQLGMGRPGDMTSDNVHTMAPDHMILTVRPSGAGGAQPWRPRGALVTLAASLALLTRLPLG